MTTLRTFRDHEGDRSNNFDALRLIFAFWVIFSHSYMFVTGNYESEMLNQVSGGQIELSSLGLHGFFLVSGYLITAS